MHVHGRRVLSCMTLAAMQQGKRITTIERLERDGILHPLQAAFIEHDGFQCGFCTPRSKISSPHSQPPPEFPCGATQRDGKSPQMPGNLANIGLDNGFA